mmetsp:Transcript_125356/g.250214  ORF Transcript_125356/g.250214 Transcript_125356/m.250214 type:complete len:153 (+) Transcript_125356:201-659(+)
MELERVFLRPRVARAAAAAPPAQIRGKIRKPQRGCESGPPLRKCPTCQGLGVPSLCLSPISRTPWRWRQSMNLFVLCHHHSGPLGIQAVATNRANTFGRHVDAKMEPLAAIAIFAPGTTSFGEAAGGEKSRAALIEAKWETINQLRQTLFWQ